MKDQKYLNELRKEFKLRLQNKQINIDLFYDNYFIEKAFHSSEIYGCNFTFEESRLYLLEGKTADNKELIDYLIIQNIYDAVKWFHTYIESALPGHELLKFLNKKLQEGMDFRKYIVAGETIRRKVLKGEYRKPDQFILSEEDYIHEKNLQERIHNDITVLLEELYYKRNFSIAYIAEFYLKFLKIAPFEMGNSRLIRILINYPIIQNYMLPVIFKSTDSKNYNAALKEADSGNPELFEYFILVKIIESYENMLGKA